MQNPNYQKQIDEILSTPLTPRNIDSYAETALNGLVDVVSKYRDNYNRLPTLEGSDSRHNELLASNYFGLPDVNTTLTHIEQKEDEITDINKVIGRALKLENVLLPPDYPKRQIVAGSGEFKSPETIPRLKTALFILENDFDVDIKDPEQLILSEGAIADSMVRNQGYFALEVPKLDRLILICDEEGNASFVFNTSDLDKSSLSSKHILGFTKQELRELIAEQPNLGVWVKYSESKFVSDIHNAIQRPVTDIDGRHSSRETDSVSYLYPRSTDDVLSVPGMAKKFGVSRDAIAKVIRDQEDLIQPKGKFKFSNNPAYGYDDQNQQKIYNELIKSGVFATEAPQGTLSINGLSNSFHIPYPTIKKAIKRLGDDVKPSGRYKFGTKSFDGYDEAAQELIYTELDRMGVFAELAPEEVLTIKGIADKHGIAEGTVSRLLKKLEDEVRPSGRYRFGKRGTIAEGYDEDAQQKILSELEARGVFAEPAPEGVLSLKGLSDKYGVSRSAISNTLGRIGDEALPSGKYRFGAQYSEGYDESAQAMIENELKSRGLI